MAAGKEAHDLHSRDFALKGIPIMVGNPSEDALKRLHSLGRLQRPDVPDAEAQCSAPAKGNAASARMVGPDKDSSRALLVHQQDVDKRRSDSWKGIPTLCNAPLSLVRMARAGSHSDGGTHC